MFIWDEAKSVRNRLKHGLTFEVVGDFDWDTPVIVDRSRHIDGETRYAAIGMLYGKLPTVIFHTVQMISGSSAYEGPTKKRR